MNKLLVDGCEWVEQVCWCFLRKPSRAAANHEHNTVRWTSATTLMGNRAEAPHGINDEFRVQVYLQFSRRSQTCPSEDWQSESKLRKPKLQYKRVSRRLSVSEAFQEGGIAYDTCDRRQCNVIVLKSKQVYWGSRLQKPDSFGSLWLKATEDYIQPW